MKRNPHEYDRRIFRLVDILNKLDSGGKVTVKALAADYAVSLRTVQRDLELLSTAGFLLHSPDKGAYMFEEGFSLQKMRLTKEEASLLTFLHEVAGSMGRNFADSAVRIFKKVMPDEYDSPYFAKLPQVDRQQLNTPFREDLEQAVDDSRKIRLVYAGKDKDGEKEYSVCPLKIINYEGFWYVLTQLDGKSWVRKFRVDRIKDVTVTEDYFEPPAKLKAMLEQSVNIWFSDRRNITVRVKVDAGAAEYFKRKVYFPAQKVVQEHKDGSVTLEGKMCYEMELIPVVQHWIPHLKVLAPKSLRDTVMKRVREYVKKG